MMTDLAVPCHAVGRCPCHKRSGQIKHDPLHYTGAIVASPCHAQLVPPSNMDFLSTILLWQSYCINMAWYSYDLLVLQCYHLFKSLDPPLHGVRKQAVYYNNGLTAICGEGAHNLNYTYRFAYCRRGQIAFFRFLCNGCKYFATQALTADQGADSAVTFRATIHKLWAGLIVLAAIHMQLIIWTH